MSKRFTDTGKWEDPWFCALGIKDKIFWVYILDRCNHAGIWQVNWSLVQFHIKGFKFNPKTFQDRILEISAAKWFIPKFIVFQYGSLNPANRLHSSVLEALEKEGASKDLASPMLGAKDKDKDKVKDKYQDKDIVSDLDVKDVDVKDVDVKDVDVVRHLEFVLLKPAEFLKLQEKLGDLTAEYLERLNGWLGQTGAHKKYKSHYHTILNWYRKDIAEGKNGAHDGKSTHHVSPPKERIGTYGKTPSELRTILDDAKSKEFFPGIRNHAVVAASEGEKPAMEDRSPKSNGERK